MLRIWDARLEVLGLCGLCGCWCGFESSALSENDVSSERLAGCRVPGLGLQMSIGMHVARNCRYRCGSLAN